MILARRSFLVGAAASLLTAPAIVRAASLMPVKAIDPAWFRRNQALYIMASSDFMTLLVEELRNDPVAILATMEAQS